MEQSIPRVRKSRTPEERLAKLEDRYRHQDMSIEERCELEDRIRRLKARA